MVLKRLSGKMTLVIKHLHSQAKHHEGQSYQLVMEDQVRGGSWEVNQVLALAL